MMGEVRGCQRCGSDDLRMPGIRDGAIIGLGQDLGNYACSRCGLMAVPLIFDDDAARRAYEAERAKDPSATWPHSGWPSVRPFDKG